MPFHATTGASRVPTGAEITQNLPTTERAILVQAMLHVIRGGRLLVAAGYPHPTGEEHPAGVLHETRNLLIDWLAWPYATAEEQAATFNCFRLLESHRPASLVLAAELMQGVRP